MSAIAESRNYLLNFTYLMTEDCLVLLPGIGCDYTLFSCFTYFYPKLSLNGGDNDADLIKCLSATATACRVRL